MKDYYQILNIPDHATDSDIKKAYRALALRFHPDTNRNNKAAEIQFREIKEAYELLSDRSKRELYDRERRYKKDTLLQETTFISPTQILLMAIKLREEVEKADPFRIDKESLFIQLKHLLSDDNRTILSNAGEEQVNDHVVEQLLVAMKPLNLFHSQYLTDLLLQITLPEDQSRKDISSFLKQKKQQDIIDKYKIPAALVCAILLCLLILYFAKK